MVNVPLDDKLAAALNAKASAQGLTVQEYLQTLLLLPTPARPTAPVSPDELDQLLDEEALLGPSPVGSFSRAEIYSDHD